MKGLAAERGLRHWFSGRRALVIGLGKSGVAAARLLARLGARVSVTEKRPLSRVRDWAGRLPASADRETGGHRFLGRAWDLAVTSPGAPARLWAPLVRRGVPVWGEMELAFRALALAGRWPSRCAAVTGTNGKTTTTALLGSIFRAAGGAWAVGGNIGTPLCDLADGIGSGTALALEVSSYQLEAADSFRPAVGAVLNVTPDHLGRHGDMETYARVKFRLFKNQGADQAAVLNAADRWDRRLAREAPGRVYWFGLRPGRAPGVYLSGGRLVSTIPGGEGSWARPRSLPGAHNIENALAAVACARALGVPSRAVAAALRTFRGVEHRLELAREWRGVRFVNDSKATNVDSTVMALRAFGGPLRVILGGEDKGAPYAPLRSLLKEKARQVLLIGEAAGKIRRELEGAAPMLSCGTLERAVDVAARSAQPGEVVLLSPACASFDQFDNFEHRGRRFKELAGAL